MKIFLDCQSLRPLFKATPIKTEKRDLSKKTITWDEFIKSKETKKK